MASPTIDINVSGCRRHREYEIRGGLCPLLAHPNPAAAAATAAAADKAAAAVGDRRKA